MTDVRNKLNQLRTNQGISLSKLSRQLEDEYDISVSPSQLNYYEKGERSPRNQKVWESLAKIFDVSVADLLNIKEDVSPYPYETYTPREEKIWIEYNQRGINKTGISFDTYLILQKKGLDISNIVEKVIEPNIENVKALYDLLNDENFKENLELQQEAYTVIEKHLSDPKKFKKLALHIVHHPSFMIYLKGLIDFDKEDCTNEADLLINYLLLDEVDKKIAFDLIQKLSDRNT